MAVPSGARLSPAAADFVKHWGLELVENPVAEASGTTRPKKRETGISWDTESQFPVTPLQEAPRCTCCGSAVEQKSDAMTQLNACHYALKNHPRIRFRGRMDSLHAYVLMAQVKRRRPETTNGA